MHATPFPRSSPRDARLAFVAETSKNWPGSLSRVHQPRRPLARNENGSRDEQRWMQGQRSASKEFSWEEAHSSVCA